MQRKRFAIFLFFALSFHCLCAQVNSPWETVAPAESFIYTDLKSALKDASVCYRIELTGAEQFKDKKVLAKAGALTEVMAFRLVNNNLVTMPSSFGNFSSLKYFYSSGNPFTTLSDSLGMWSQLRFMELSGTNFDTLPGGIYGCGRMQSISVNSNLDTLTITKEISSLGKTLSEIKIYSTPVDSLPAELAQMPALRKLVFYKCGFTEMPDAFLQMNHLQELWLDSNSISVLPRSISTMSKLTYLSLRGNRITHIPGTICFLQNLTLLDLRGNPIDPYEIKIVQALLPSCRILF
ncbi:MAG: leucine-rich repeat domain-containing protein [Bacteroidota bacterium]|nr:leucine-rich repeat domain-containing protein [Bacteroidota bacterium]